MTVEVRDDVYEVACWVIHDYASHHYWCDHQKALDTDESPDTCTCGLKDALKRLDDAARLGRSLSERANQNGECPR